MPIKCWLLDFISSFNFERGNTDTQIQYIANADEKSTAEYFPFISIVFLHMVTLNINGQDRQLDVPDEMPLLWALRDVLMLTGAKYGCGVGVCGACSVLIDDTAVRSCQLPVSLAVGTKIITIEGISNDHSHPVQKAWMELDVPQCGYCQAGQIINAVALLKANPKPTDEDINLAMKDDVCRCGTYQRIREAIHKAAGQ